MAAATSREDLIGYAMRSLGAPVIRVNIDPTQAEDRIDDALDLFWEFHSEGSELVFLHRQITQQDKDRGYFELPANIISVLGVSTPGGASGMSSANLSYQMYITDIMDARRIATGGLGSYYITQSWLGMLNGTFNNLKRVTFNHHHGRLNIMASADELAVNSWVAVECYQAVSPTDFERVYNNRWLKKYVVAQFKKQWGDNLIKYGGAQLPGGVTINAEQLYNDGRTDCKELEEELKSDYQLPCDFYMG